MHFLEWNCFVCDKIFTEVVPKGPINNIPPLVQIMAWPHPGDKPLSESIMVILPMHICVTWPQWVNTLEQVLHCLFLHLLLVLQFLSVAQGKSLCCGALPFMRVCLGGLRKTVNTITLLETNHIMTTVPRYMEYHSIIWNILWYEYVEKKITKDIVFQNVWNSCDKHKLCILS